MRRGAAVALAAVCVLSACTDEAAAPEPVGAVLGTVQPGVLTACVVPTPQLVEPGGEHGHDGFDIAVLDHVATELELPLELVVVGYDELVSGTALNDMRCDIGAGGVLDDPARDALVVRSTPYRVVHRVLVASGPDAVPPVDDLATLTATVGVVQGGAAVDAVAGLPDGAVEHPSRTDLVRALRTGSVDLALVATVELPAVVDQLDSATPVGRVPTSAETVLLLPLDASGEAVELVDEALSTLQSDQQRYQDLLTRWFG